MDLSTCVIVINRTAYTYIFYLDNDIAKFYILEVRILYIYSPYDEFK